MRIGFVAEPYEESHASGMGYVIREMMCNLVQEGTKHQFVIYSSKRIDRVLVPGNFENILIPKTFIGKLFWFSRLRDVDILVHMVALLPLWVPRNIKTVLLCQELADQHMHGGDLRQRLIVFMRDDILMPPCVAKASKIIAASNATARDLEQFYNVPSEKIVVVHDGFQDLTQAGMDASIINEDMRPYFFFAGKVKLRKNVHRIVSAFIAFKERTKARCNLVIAGDYGGDYYESMRRELEQHHLTDAVHFIGYTTGDAQLHALYVNALAFVFPSLSEGFGMPLAEAMSLGVPVITSKISAMPEVMGEAGILVDPYDTEDISGAMERVFNDTVLRKQMTEKGLHRAKSFSWQRAAREALVQIENVYHA